MTTPTINTPYRLGGLHLPSRLVRAGTSETMAGERGEVTDQLIELHRRLVAGGIALSVLGHAYVHPRGQYLDHQTGMYDDTLLPGLSRLTDAVHAEGGKLVAQLAHAGSQSRMRGIHPLAPSAVPNALVGTLTEAADEPEIDEALDAFAAAARRAKEAGFDGVHIHGANGYLISEFSSPLANTRDDLWGGDAQRRSRFFIQVVERVRAAVGDNYPVTAKVGMVDAVEGGLELDESVARVGELVRAGLDGVEVSVGVMTHGSDSCRTYVAVDRRRARRDLLVHRWFADGPPEAYFEPWAAAVKQAHPGLTVMLVGGLRTPNEMNRLLRDGVCDLVAMARPLIREPDLPTRLLSGGQPPAACTSCNLCLMHEGQHALQCWRTPRWHLAHHAIVRLRGSLRSPR
jgi:2,4-dienoyl-CoA reductase-like NADH-dependent reductase (Old Yellow Enzyme family)